MGIERMMIKFIGRSKKPRRDNTLLKEKNIVGGLQLPDFKTYHKATIIDTVCYR